MFPRPPLVDNRSITLTEALMRVRDRKPVWRVWGATPGEWLVGVAFTVVFMAIMLPACSRAHRTAADGVKSTEMPLAAAASALAPS
jgi:hypothetical protein